MSLNNRCVRSAERGVIMIVALISLVIVAGLMTVMLQSVTAEHVGVQVQFDRTQAIRLDEGMLQVAEDQLIQAVANYQPFPAPPQGSPFEVLSGSYTFNGISGTWNVSRATTTTGGTQTAVAAFNRTDTSTGLQQVVESYTIEAVVRHGTSSVTMRKDIEMQKTPIFQFLAYYNGDLEILPGPAMTLGGRIHSNGDIFLGPGTSLAVNSPYMRTSGKVHRHRKDTSAIEAGPVTIRDQTSATNALRTLPSKTDLTALSVTSTYGMDSDFTGWDRNHNGRFSDSGDVLPFRDYVTNLFHGTLQTGEHGVTSLANPSIGSLSAYEPTGTGTGGDYAAGSTAGTYVAVAAGTGAFRKGYYHKNAQLIIINTTVYNHDGTNITSSMPSGFLTQRTLWDQRENRYQTVTEVNVGKLGDMDGNANTMDRCPYYPSNGLIYATRTDCSPGAGNGIVLTNGAAVNIPPKWNSNNYGTGGSIGGSAPSGAHAFTASENLGLTVVSPCPVYVKGDYNTSGKKPCSVITDTINLLSNAWDYSKGPNQAKTASNTTYNMAVITGNQNTTTGHYNGGFENLPRFHENWSGKTATIVGSFVNTWRSSMATGAWVYGGAYYDAPTRAWSFDSTYDTGALPPFTPMAISTRTTAFQVSD